MNNINSLSIKNQRKAIGILGGLLPIILIVGNYLVGNCGLPPSISDTFYSPTGMIFVIFMGSMGMFFLNDPCYTVGERIAFTIAGISAILVAMFSCNHTTSYTCVRFLIPDNAIRNLTHYISASVFFLSLAYLCLFEFPKITHSHTHNKRIRNRIYIICGILILCSIIAKLLGANTLLIEVTALEPFAIAFLTKGDIIYPDKKQA